MSEAEMGMKKSERERNQIEERRKERKRSLGRNADLFN